MIVGYNDAVEAPLITKDVGDQLFDIDLKAHFRLYTQILLSVHSSLPHISSKNLKSVPDSSDYLLQLPL